MMRGLFLSLFAVSLFPPASAGDPHTRSAPSSGYRDWRTFGGSQDNIHYSNIDSINPSNVHRLQVAWSFDTGDAFKGSEMQCGPISVDGVVYVTSPKLRVFALDAATGRQIWSFDPFEGQSNRGYPRNRGVAYWTDGQHARIFTAANHWLYSLDAGTGKPDPAFGQAGRIDLRESVKRPVDSGSITITTPGVVHKDLYIAGSLVSEGLPAYPGDIRAFDVRTGALRWQFHTIPHPGEFGYDTWPKDAYTYIGGANSWPGLALDVKRGMVFAPTGSAAFDFYGSNRHGDNLFANSLIALDANTGRRIWHFQAVKHDVWDRDFPAAPALVTVLRDGRLVDAVAQISKSGHIWVFDRQNGKSLFPLKTLQVPPSPVDGERLAGTQTLPLAPPPVSRQEFTEDMVTRRTPEAHRMVLERFNTVKSGPQFTPPTLEGTIIFPGFDGGGEWGGAAFDPETGLLYVNANEMPWILRLIPRPKTQGRMSGRNLYMSNCAACHRDDLGGSPPNFPSLKDLSSRFNDDRLVALLQQGVGRMPGFKQLGDPALKAISRFLLRGEDSSASVLSENSPIHTKYIIDGYNKFLDPDGYPAVQPPWGTLNAVNLDTGKIEWKIPFGEHPELAAKGMKDTGSENYGGGIVTRGGLFLIAASNKDRKLRAFDKRTGKLLWETLLPFSGNATPALFELNGKPYLVVAAGGGKSGATSGGIYVAFTLPD